MHNEINKENNYNQNKNTNSELNIFRNNYYSKNSSFIIDTFYFEKQSNIVCLSCNNIKTSFNISNILIFPLEKVREYKINKYKEGFMSITLEDCFENYQ